MLETLARPPLPPPPSTRPPAIETSPSSSSSTFSSTRSTRPPAFHPSPRQSHNQMSPPLLPPRLPITTVKSGLPAPTKRDSVRVPPRRSSLLSTPLPYEALQQLARAQQQNGRRRSAVVAPTTRRPSLLTPHTPPTQPHPQPLLTRRGSLMLTATMRAMGQSLPPATMAALAAGTALAATEPEPWTGPCRRKSNQDDGHRDGRDDSDSDSDSDSDDDATHTERKTTREDSNQSPEPVAVETAARRTSPPPPYFRLATFMLEDHDATPPTSPSASTSTALSSHARPLPSPPTSSSSCAQPPSQPIAASLSSPQRTMAPTPSKAAQIDALFREIWQTEESYVAALRGLVTQFFEPLQAFAKIHGIELGAMAALHHSTSTILSIHDELLRQLEPLHTNHEPLVPGATSSSGSSTADPFGVGFTGTLARLHHLSRAFLSTIEYMKVYAFYCGSYLSAKQELERLQRQHPKLAAFTAQLNECARRGSQEEEIELLPLDINSSLIKPVQRICRYPLLFKNLLNNASGPEETLVLQQSLQKIEAVSNYVNEKVRESQNNARLYQLHQMLHPSSGLELLQPSRTLLYETWANVASLDALRWPAKLLRHFRRKRQRQGQAGRRRSSLAAPQQLQPSTRDDWFRLSVFGLGLGLGDDRRSSATATAQSMRSRFGGSISLGTGGSGSSDRHTSFSAASTTTQYLSSPPGTPSMLAPPQLQRRRSSGGERSRLILLSDMLLMAKLKEQKLKIRRQICLSCAVVHDDALPPPPPPSPPRTRPYSPRSDGDCDENGDEDELLPPVSAVAVAAAIDDENASYSFTLEVSKVGRCSCHHFSPATLKRSPKLRSLSAFLSGRRSSASFGSSAGELLQALHEQQQQHELEDRRTTELSRAPSLTRHSSRTSKASTGGSRFRYLEQLAGIRSVKRYRVTCDTVQEKARLLKALRQAIARSARLQLLGAGGRSGSGSELSLSRAPSSTGAKAVAIAVSLPVKIWRSFRSASESSSTTRMTTTAMTTSQTLRRAGSLAVVSSAVSASSSMTREADLLHLEDSESETSRSFPLNAA